MPPRKRAAATTAPKRGARPTAITSVQKKPRFKNWMVAGDTGVGKTTFASSLPDALFVTFEEEGTESALVEGSQADEIVVRTRKEYMEAQDYFELGTGCEDYGWVIMDSVSEMEECFWRSQLADQHERKPSTRSLYKPALDDYPWVWNQVKAAVSKWNSLPVNVLYTAQVMPLEMYDDDAEEEFEQLVPMIGSQKNGILARKVAGMVSLLGHYQVMRGHEDDEEEDTEEFRRLYVSPRKDILAKNRYGWQAYTDDPNLPSLVAAADKALAGKGPRAKNK
jgi:AAA domain